MVTWAKYLASFDINSIGIQHIAYAIFGSLIKLIIRFLIYNGKTFTL